MNDDEIVLALRVEGTRSTPVQLAEFLNSVAAGGLSQGSLVTFFKRAFPAIPLGVLLESGAWNRISGGPLGDDGFNTLLGPWIGR